jgi:fatty-acyl-CoA synthase
MLGKTIGQLYDYCCLHYRDRTAIIHGLQRWSFGQLAERGNRLTNSLRRLGLQKEDRLAVLMPNCPEVLLVDYACAKLGLVRVPLAHYLRPDDVLLMVKETETKVLVYHELFKEIIQTVRKAYGGFQHVLCLSAAGTTGLAGELSFRQLVDEGSPGAVPEAVNENDLYIIAYTGGTTGLPKGVVHNHRTFVASMAMELLDFGIGRDEVFLAFTPLTHASGALVMPVWLRGGRLVILPGFDAKLFLETVQREKVTTSFLVPTVIYTLLDYPDLEKYDTSSLRNLIYGAAPIAPERLKEAIQTFGPIFTQLYGQAEAPMALTALSREEHIIEGNEQLVGRLASCGRPNLAVKLKLVDAQGQEVPLGQSGQIIAQAPNTMIGYFKRPELTAETLKDGWLYTGDVARQDEYGYFYIVDRAKDMIVSGGFNIFPKELEDILHEHPAVAIAAVIGVPDEKWGEAVKAVVVLRPGQKVGEKELIDFCKREKGSLMAPKSVDFSDSLPLTPLGKANKKALRDKYWQGRTRRVS